MTTKIAKVSNLAWQVFNQYSLKASSISAKTLSQSCLPKEKLNQLLSLLNMIDGRDVGFDINWIKTTASKDGSNVSAPVIYVHIMENEVFSLGIFVLRPGSRIPLHDHPNMFGMVKVIHGNLRCRSYSRVPTKLPLSSFTSRLTTWQMSDLIATKPYQDNVLEANSEPILLSPAEGNFHELFTVGNEGAAFVDILAPPYDHFLGKRECHYYQEVSIPRPLSPHNGTLDNTHNNTNDLSESAAGAKGDEPSQGYVYLAETHQPKDYWCDSAEYRGPRVL